MMWDHGVVDDDVPVPPRVFHDKVKAHGGTLRRRHVVGLAVTDGACGAGGTSVGGTETVGDDVGQEVPEASAPFSSHISVGPYGAVPLKNVPPNVQ